MDADNNLAAESTKDMSAKQKARRKRIRASSSEAFCKIQGQKAEKPSFFTLREVEEHRGMNFEAMVNHYSTM